ncbi:MAG: hypothetical protein IJV15_00045 [Lachnospiraceae bacterium]|nr:hypothetical protein [Lachnospiraceae bacterium]
MLKIKTTPKFDFNKYDCGFGFVIHRENESKKYIRDCKIINYLFGIVFLWFSFGIEIEVSRKGR